MVEVAVPPATGVAISPPLGLDVEARVWLAFPLALCGQVGWAAAGALRAGRRAAWAPRRPR